MTDPDSVHSPESCARLVDRFLPAVADLPKTIHAALSTGSRPARRDLVNSLGQYLWDVFSDNHTVVDENGIGYELGSFRGSADFLADRVMIRYSDVGGFDYMDFYMGTMRRGSGEVYRWVFSGLKELNCNWIYTFPRVYVIGLDGAESADERRASFLDYDPSEAFQKELEEGDRETRNAELAAAMDRAYHDAIDKARDRPLPTTVAAYVDVYGRMPTGWPHPGK